MLERRFQEILQKYSEDIGRIKMMWHEVESYYSKTYRHYHTLNHLSHFFKELEKAKRYIKDWDSTLLAMFYHDIVFLPTRNDNEKSSSDLAEISLAELDVSEEKIDKCQKMILATKEHKKSDDSDVNYFIDADISIIGSDEITYESYLEGVKQEYYFLSEDEYIKGRKKIIHHFLKMKKIFKTNFFYQQYEKKARKNLMKELRELSQLSPNLP